MWSEADCGHKAGFKVLTMLNFLTTPGCEPIKYFTSYIEIFIGICAAYAQNSAGLEVEQGHKVKFKVVTPLNFLTSPSFSVTPPSCKPSSDSVELSDPPEFFRDPAKL